MFGSKVDLVVSNGEGGERGVAEARVSLACVRTPLHLQEGPRGALFLVSDFFVDFGGGGRGGGTPPT